MNKTTKIGIIICNRYRTARGRQKNYLDIHTDLGTWENAAEWEPLLAPTMTDEATRKAYD